MGTNIGVFDIDRFDLDKETAIRKRIFREFNKTPEDFVSLREYNDYLEEIEDIIFNLVNNVDIDETNRRITEYREKNKDQIAARQAQRYQEERQKRMLEQQRQREDEMARMAAEAADKFQPTSSIIDSKGVNLQQQPAGMHLPPVPHPIAAGETAAAASSSYVPTAAMDMHNAARMQPAPKTAAPLPSSLSQSVDPETMQLRTKAGGYNQEMVMQRAFQEAFGTLVC